jgi:hypothetical protein
MTTKSLMVNFKIPHSAAALASPAVSFEDLPMQLLVFSDVYSARRMFFDRVVHEV